MSKFFIETPFDRWLIFDMEKSIRVISFSLEKKGQILLGSLRRDVLEVFKTKDFAYFNYNLLDLSNISERARKLHNFLVSTKPGQVYAYSEVARILFGDYRYTRAVARMLNANRFAFFVPCHRIVAKSGIGGYAAGVDLKISILRWEGFNVGVR